MRILMLVLLAACGDNLAAPPVPPDATRVWSCTMERNCAGDVVNTARDIPADTEQDAELVMIGACHETPCTGALDCSAVCVMP